MSIRVKVEGLSELQDVLRRLPDATAKNVVRRVLRKQAKPVAEKARSLAPKDQGDLRESIVVSTKLTKTQRKKHRKFDPNDIEVFIGPGPHPHAHLQEFGSSRHPPQPFLRPGWDATKMAVLGGIGDDLWAEIKKAVARAARKAAKAGT